jgi:hypothetical protein
MREEIEDLWSLAEECRVWERHLHGHDAVMTREFVATEFKRLADKLDEIAKRLAEKT